jgi:hypothetical protein
MKIAGFAIVLKFIPNELAKQLKVENISETNQEEIRFIINNQNSCSIHQLKIITKEVTILELIESDRYSDKNQIGLLDSKK